MIQLSKPYLTSNEMFIFNIDGVQKQGEGDLTNSPEPKVIITFENGSLIEVEIENVDKNDMGFELWWELQGVISYKIEELKQDSYEIK